jgi:hypothetical protein
MVQQQKLRINHKSTIKQKQFHIHLQPLLQVNWVPEHQRLETHKRYKNTQTAELESQHSSPGKTKTSNPKTANQHPTEPPNPSQPHPTPPNQE